jgi:WD40 repeat protein
VAHEGPVLSTAFNHDGSMVFSGGADNTVRVWNLGANGTTAQVIGRHDSAVKSVHWVQNHNM